MFLVCPHGVQGHHELAGDGRAVQLAAEQPQDIQFAFAQRLDQCLLRGAVVLGPARGGQKPAEIGPPGRLPGRA